MGAALKAREEENRLLEEVVSNQAEEITSYQEENSRLKEERDANHRREKRGRFWRTVRDVGCGVGLFIMGVGVGSLGS